ncbi:hypothetical protein [Arboricoccus pini]|uniref:hypothetical protein n=1 Tax=Arboricoccus pini TaxID=1963835 RepID=UPI000B50D638|nr:hypothetical protein [Arboricoccus pini]
MLSSSERSAIIGSVGQGWHIVGFADARGDDKTGILSQRDSGVIALWQLSNNQVLHATSIVSVNQI